MAHINNDSVAAGLFSPCLKVLSLFAFAGLSPSMIGLYDDQGMLRFSGRDTLACLDYAELFGLTPDGYCLQALSADEHSESQSGIN
ncbi:hypothetical protein KQ302_12685 [Synechococcus sp. CS-602]|uniref:hypothetical protein n=2 Tax=unclassified Synechococcus TaxID=2626047 RepID=UPI0011A3D069|nr:MULTISPECIES: hypothetical protein [unclassified Synechococcus]MCT0205945.1 hypothetical protein [Synechococcus sp. CS-602]MCT4366394.1 hypothetical protein [Candidatus Regnicoccus frigidus MAG-AL2]TWB90420.1 hypothetical protein FB106_11078 [Synechococcus sp. Ace-Pa]